MKTCPNCGVEVVGKRADARYCSETCRSRSSGRRYASRHPEKVVAHRREQNAKTEQRIIYRIKSRAKRAGIAFNLTVEDVQVPDVCPVLGITLRPNAGRKGYFPDSPSVDRIDPKLGYVRGNVRVISNRANLLKSDASVAELEAVLSDLRRLHPENL